MGNEIVKPQSIAMQNGMVKCETIEDAYRFAKFIVASRLAPANFDTPEKVLIACQLGAEVGLKPMQSLQSIAVVNGRPSLYGKAIPGIVWPTGLLEVFEEWNEGDGDDFTALCKVKRKGIEGTRLEKFSVADAKKANLWQKGGPWTQYPKDMLKYKARARAFSALFADVLCGLAVKEDIEDVAPQARGDDPPPQPIVDPLMDKIIDVSPVVVNNATTETQPAAVPAETSGNEAGVVPPSLAPLTAPPPVVPETLEEKKKRLDAKKRKPPATQTVATEAPKDAATAGEMWSGLIVKVERIGKMHRIKCEDGGMFYTLDDSLAKIAQDFADKMEAAKLTFRTENARRMIVVFC